MSTRIEHAEASAFLAVMPDNSVDLILTDPPYFRVKDEAWDRQWENPAEFVAWLATIADEWRRVLKPNGSLYCFASPQMSARVECMLGDRFEILNHIVWNKTDSGGRHRAACKEDLRGFFPASERIIFAEKRGSDSVAMDASGYAAKCSDLRGSVFEPLLAYFRSERARSSLSAGEIQEGMHRLTGARYVFERHAFSRSQYELPTRTQYMAARALFGAGYFTREYEDLRREYEDLRREYEDLRREYEDLRRPFAVSADVPFTDVWAFPTVPAYQGKHPCEKPAALLEHIIATSSRPADALVVDCFLGSGATAVAAQKLGRAFAGCDMSEHWAAYAARCVDRPPARAQRSYPRCVDPPRSAVAQILLGPWAA